MEFYYHETDKDMLIIRADGGLNIQTAAQFTRELEGLIDGGLRKIIVDCERLDYISSYGLGVLARLHAKLKHRGGDVKLAGVKGMAVSVLRATRLDSLLEMYPDVDRARLMFRPPDAAPPSSSD